MRFSALLEWLEWAAGVMRTLPGVAARRFPIGTADAKFGMPHRNGDSTNGRKWAIIIFNGNFSFHITLSPCFPFTGLPSCRCETGLAKKNTKTVRGPDWLCSKAKKKKGCKNISRDSLGHKAQVSWPKDDDAIQMVERFFKLPSHLPQLLCRPCTNASLDTLFVRLRPWFWTAKRMCPEVAKRVGSHFYQQHLIFSVERRGI